LHEARFIRSPFLFTAFVRILGGESGAAAGEYSFKRPVGVIRLAHRVARAEYGIEKISITIPEGTSVREISKILRRKLPRLNPEDFLRAALPYEGYLFPDTYFFPENIGAEDVVSVMRENFNRRMREVSPLLIAFRRPISDVIVMSSLVEEEARTEETRRRIAGILWKRLRIGMPLQVDAVFPYILGKNTFQVTFEDLQFDSPYNTYRFAGLPPGPITNPGLDAIRATLTPIETPYFYYLSDMQGEMHYAVTHDEHVQNKEKYLR
jgi:UPF0755 protein